MKELNAWLDSHRTQSKLSPVTWSDLPDDLKLRLENLARDESVRRADEFASEGYLDLSRHDAVRQLVNAMAQAWTLPGDKVCRVVEDYIDELPPDPGHEFDKLADKLFRRRVSTSWEELSQIIDEENLLELVANTLEDVALPPQSVMDKHSFLDVLHNAYDAWSIANPREAVKEVFELISGESKKKNIALSEIRELAEKRGAKTFIRALDLELEVGIEQVEKDELVRIIKRYSLIQKRRDEKEVTGISTDSTYAVESETLEEPVTDEAVQDDKEHADYEDEEVEPEDDSEMDLVEVEEAVKDEFVREEAETESGIQVDEPVELGDDEKAIEALFGSDDTTDLLDSISSDKDFEGVAIEDAEMDESSDQIEKKEDIIDFDKALEETDVLAEEEEEKVETESESEKANSLDESLEEAEAGEEETDLDFLEPSVAEADTDETEEAVDDTASSMPGIEKKTSRKKSGRINKRFAPLLKGEFRDKIVQNMYGEREEQLDLFLAKLSGAQDWNRAKQFIANELFRYRIDLNSELGEQFYVVLKDCMGEK